ncbi:4-hydroxy-tetrahydrodipicolinate synthase [Orbus hercynius]|uniref:4-hydroxy-tetrahydrodipicolinate synthase n=1 Tax=Orbus hercynius TaxID=593135 RepID=A0A495RKU5_9GAMM|nr:dihydrodipicolinate synthase family protein [Orbus hercynius]RKS87796.1 4-hydroxy-tetrahydrodipicolinate synthase [Orbus hercynius]
MTTQTHEKTQLTGAICPSVTPFTQAGKIDFNALEQHYKRLTDAKLSGILVMGTIGEFANMNIQERLSVIDAAKQMTSLPLIAHVSSTVVSDILLMAEKAYSNNYDAVMILPPYYYGQTPNQLISYFEYLDSQLAGNWYIYNFPARTGCDVDVSIVKHLMNNCPRFAGIKDTVDCASHTRLITLESQKIRQDFSVFAGFDEYFAPNLMNNGAGVLSGLTNIVPEVFVSLFNAYKANDLTTVANLHKKIAKLSEIYLVGDDFVTTIKTAVAQQFGYMKPISRNFNGTLNSQQIKRIEEILKA